MFKLRPRITAAANIIVTSQYIYVRVSSMVLSTLHIKWWRKNDPIYFVDYLLHRKRRQRYVCTQCTRVKTKFNAFDHYLSQLTIQTVVC